MTAPKLSNRVAKLEKTIHRENDLKAIVPPAVLVDYWEGRPVETEGLRAIYDTWTDGVGIALKHGTVTLQEALDVLPPTFRDSVLAELRKG